jgi:outer membrane protein TolC
VLLFLATASVFRVAMILLAIPFSLVGAVWLLWLLGYHLSGAVWVGMIALAGLDAETGLVMLLYLDNSYERFKAQGRMKTKEDLLHAVHDGAVKRIRPKTMTVAAAFLGLVPLLWSSGTGADVMRRLAAPMLGGLFTSFLMELLIYPVIFYVARSISMRRAPAGGRPLKNWRTVTAAIAGMIILFGAGCTVHPEGEASERAVSKSAGAAFSKRFEAREISRLPANPSVDDLVNYALLSNAEVEQRYWEWRSAIEQVTQDGTQPTNLSISASSVISKGRLSWDRTSVTVGNDPMADIVWPAKLSIAAHRSLENARAAGIRFQKARYELRGKVLAGYDDFALTAKLIGIEESTAALLSATAAATEARNRAGSARQQDVLKAQIDFDLSRNDAAMLRSRISAQRAALNALLGREPGAELEAPDALPPSRALTYTDQQVLDLAEQQNPELRALAAELRGKEDGIRLARLEYLPDFSLSFGTDLEGLSQTLLGALTAPLLRFESINAAIAQSEANLRAAESMRRQSKNDLAAQVVSDLVGVRDADRQLGLFHDNILPRARRAVTLSRSGYESGQASLLEFLDNQRSLLAIERLDANLQTTRDKRLSELETVAARSLSAGPTPGRN